MPKSARRIASGALMLALAAGTTFTGSTAVQAQGQNNTSAPGSWQSAINLQNTAGTAATVSIDFVNANGQVVKTYTPSAPIPANGSLEVFVPTQVADLTAGQYSAVVNSDQPVKATINLGSNNSSTGPYTMFAYEGIGAAESGKTLYYPGLYNSYYSFFSEMVVQNADTAPATLTASFYRQDGGKIADVPLGTLAPNASKTFPMQALSQLPKGNPGGGNPGGIFGAVVTSSEGRNLVGIANNWRTSPTNGTSSYNAYTSGSPTLFAPGLYNNYYGFESALTVQAVGGAAAGTIMYSNGQTQSFNLAANAAQAFFQPDNTNLPSGNQGGVFSAKVTATSGQVVGIVSLSVRNAVNGRGDFASYNLPKQASPNVSIPNVMDDYYGFFTAITVQNTGATATNVTIRYATGATKTFSNVAPNGTVPITHLPGANADGLINRVNTSAVISSSNGAPLVAVVQHNTDPKVAGYNAAKTPRDFLMAVTGSPQ